jgi:hypothetical protein
MPTVSVEELAAGEPVGHGARPQHNVHPRRQQHGVVLGRDASAGAIRKRNVRGHRDRR